MFSKWKIGEDGAAKCEASFFKRTSKLDLKLAVLKYSIFSLKFPQKLFLLSNDLEAAISCVNWFECGPSWLSDISVCCQFACFVIISQSYVYFIKFSYWSKNGQPWFVLSMFLSFGQIWGWCSFKIVLIEKIRLFSAVGLPS